MEELIADYSSRIEKAIDIANDVKESPYFLRSKLLDFLLDMSFHSNLSGFCPKELKIFLNELLNNKTRYLQIGLGRGGSFVPAMFRNDVKHAVGIDSFGGFLYDDSIKTSFKTTAENFGIIDGTTFHLIEEDCFKLKNKHKEILQKEKFDVYFYDGYHHTVDDHMKALTQYYEYMDDVFIFIVDEWTYPPVSEGTKLGIQKCGLKVKKEWELGRSRLIQDPENLSWNNGLYVAIMEK